MGWITAEQAAIAASSTVRIATLVELQFRSATKRLYNGDATIDVAGYAWEGAAGLARIDGMRQDRAAQANAVTMSLSGVAPDILALAVAEQSEVAGRRAYGWFQLFGPDWQPIGSRILWLLGTMTRISVEREPASDEDGGMRSIALEIENAWVSRARPAVGRWNDGDHQFRYPGDTFFEFAGQQQNKPISWP